MWHLSSKVKHLSCSQEINSIVVASKMCLLDLPQFLDLCLSHQLRALPTYRNDNLSLVKILNVLTFQALASQLSDYHDKTDLADIHLLVKRQLAAMTIGDGGQCQGELSRFYHVIQLVAYQVLRRGPVF